MNKNNRRYKPKRLNRGHLQEEQNKYEENIYNFKIDNNNQDENNKINISEEVHDNGTLLISELQNKIFLPYKAEEVEEILNQEGSKYISAQEVIDNVFTKKFSHYKNQFTARFRESVELITKRENMSLLDGANLGTELFGKRYLHPAIISACKNLDELNVYLDCLDKNELDDFKIFEIKYEIPPMVRKNRF